MSLFFLSGLNNCSNQKAQLLSQDIKPGIEVLLEQHIHLLKGKRVGLVTNPTGINTHLKTTIEVLFDHPDVKLTALYGPEHGVRGNTQAGEYVPFYMDQKTRLPVFSLYGQTKKPDDDMLNRIDEYMRSFDTTHEGKTLNQEMVSKLDVMIFDMQDVGTRIYTYIAT
ncbi:MAG: DUF1343 domain-containing protein, partial [Candidatus Aminicenantes bacterium]|nr:DUF1343 domain-containing protein [Candidatus Aminicenantes bacterium]